MCEHTKFSRTALNAYQIFKTVGDLPSPGFRVVECDRLAGVTLWWLGCAQT
jgi:hypothetical protein